MKTPFVAMQSVAEAINKISDTYQNVGSVYDRTMKDMISRTPGKIASSVTSIYGIKKSEISYKKVYKSSAGSIRVGGDNLASLEFQYSGRVLTPLHFGMTPKNRPEKSKYKVKAKIKKQAKAFKAPADGGVFLPPAAKGSATIIPWMRLSSLPDDIKPIKTLSLPQMVDNQDVKKLINNSVADLLHKRFDHHMTQYIKGHL